MQRLLIVMAVVFSLMCFTGVAHASIINPDIVSCQLNGWDYRKIPIGDGYVSDPDTDIEFKITNKYDKSMNYFDIQVEQDTISITSHLSQTYTDTKEITIGDIDFTDGSTIIGYNIIQADQDIPVTFGSDWVTFNMAGANGISWSVGDAYQIQLTTSAVPIPSAVMLLGSGLVGIAGVYKRKRKIE